MSSGHRHPISTLISDIVSIFSKMGFAVAEGPEIESEWYNFDALNVPADHPSRDMQDTFFIKGRDKTVLRTHTSPVQVRYLEAHKDKLPIRIIVPGKVYRNEATDATHEAQFYQVEGLMVGEGVTLANLKAVLERFFTELFGKKLSVRLRAGFFPFVEPGVEVDMECFKCEGKGCALCKKTGWIEIMGAGMVHPTVLKNAGVDLEKYQGFAFGTGIDRLAILKWGIDDVRLMYNGDLRFINQF
ncbi:MAG: phenylalanine--tRNA ligase subunit alpha [Candidatus Taylorbacteria bacterium RIFCSPHIGHO2_01_FULL_51_15]|uniref:phenylalanine--tRNA ligase n=1 Tax=Candidatus Taylorbacteria bacterium RIFCSPHIGHO2_01_FULL_51_15 TaxID=1802304 RepID=A0A1G2MAH5_9BACT|nr:MAG: phenylalanine--tRNA ligase subunit alpha [Candidatus Taylorbacteria bacterium RIFCSPHIGHO2_01_FULL_51_15]